MVRYACESRDRSGRLVERTVEAGSQREAIALLERDGLFPVELKEVGTGRNGKAAKRPAPRRREREEREPGPVEATSGRVPIRELRTFSMQLASSIRAGVPMIAALDSIGRQTTHKRFAAVIARLVEDVRAGEALSAALAAHPKVFSDVYSSTVAAGEQAGSLDEVLDYLSTFIEDRMEVRSDVRSALMYPVVVVLALFGAIGVLLIFVVPRFGKLYSGFGKELPLPTQVLLAVSDAVVQNLLLGSVALAFAIFGLARYLGTEEGQRTRDRVLLRLPLIRTLVSTSNTVQVAQLLGLFTRAGVPLMQGLETIARAASSIQVRDSLQRVASLVSDGQSLSTGLEQTNCLTPAARQMIATGEESGSLERSCEAVAKQLRSELRYLTRNLGTLIEPILTGLLAVLVLGVALAVFLPMWDMVKLAQD